MVHKIQQNAIQTPHGCQSCPWWDHTIHCLAQQYPLNSPDSSLKFHQWARSGSLCLSLYGSKVNLSSWRINFININPEIITAMLTKPWTLKICLECLLCCNQSHASSSRHRNHIQRSRNKLFSFLFQHSIFLQVNNCFSFLFVYSIEYMYRLKLFRMLQSKIVFWKEYSENWAVYFAPCMLISSAVFLAIKELLTVQ